jgi:ribose transport system permease protein
MSGIEQDTDSQVLLDERNLSRKTGRFMRVIRMKESLLVLVLVIIVAFFSVEATGFTSGDNIKTILIYLSVLGVLAVGQTLRIIAGGFDLSDGANLAFSSVIGAEMLTHGYNAILAVVVVLLVASAVGLLNGFLVAVMNVNSFIATLATYLILSGAAYVASGSNTVEISLNQWTQFGRGNIGFAPDPVIILVVFAVAAALILRYTVFGRSLFAIGGNAHAARLAGISLRKNLLLVFTLSGLSAGIAALIQTSLASAGSATFTGQLNLQAITCVILGGAALSGGEGGIFGTIIGVVIIQTILDGLSLMNISTFYQNIVTGFVLLIAVMLASARLALAGRHFMKRRRTVSSM